MENRVVVENKINSKVIFVVPELRFSRIWEKKGVKRTIDFEVLKEGLYRPGNEYLFKNDILYIKDKDVRIELGIDDPADETPRIELDDKKMQRYLTVAPTIELKELLPKLTVGQLQSLVDYAIEHELTSIDKCEAIKQYTKKDIIKIIQLKKEMEKKETEEN